MPSDWYLYLFQKLRTDSFILFYTNDEHRIKLPSRNIHIGLFLLDLKKYILN